MDYWNGKICEFGHIVDYGASNDSPYCIKCGSSVVSECSNCSSLIRGAFKLYGFYDAEDPLLENMEYPNYCYGCGKPFPWTENILNNAVEILALDITVDSLTKDIIRNAIPNLLVYTPTSPLAAAKYNMNINKFSQPIKDAMRQLLVDVVSDTLKKSIFPDF